MFAPLAGLAGSLVGSGLNFLGASRANQMSKKMAREQMGFQGNMAREAMLFSKDQAKTQMDFQERMSNTAFQRMTQDLRQAGLNPILAMNVGGASTPGGAAGQGYSAQGSSFQAQNELSGAVSSAIDSQRAFAEIKNMRATNQNLQAQNDLLRQQTNKTAAETQNIRQGKYGQIKNLIEDTIDEVFGEDSPLRGSSGKVHGQFHKAAEDSVSHLRKEYPRFTNFADKITKYLIERIRGK